MTNDFYDQNSEDFVGRTVDLDMGAIHRRFMDHVPPPAKILDAGCGSGRDTRAFLDLGYDVIAIDASESMVRAARCLVGEGVLHVRFQEMTFDQEFDGIWASASLLHIPHSETIEVYRRFIKALKPGGHWYLSYKLGQGEHLRGGRLFVDHDEESLTRLLAQFEELSVIDTWQTADVRVGRENERWLNCLVQRPR